MQGQCVRVLTSEGSSFGPLRDGGGGGMRTKTVSLLLRKGGADPAIVHRRPAPCPQGDLLVLIEQRYTAVANQHSLRILCSGVSFGHKQGMQLDQR